MGSNGACTRNRMIGRCSPFIRLLSLARVPCVRHTSFPRSHAQEKKTSSTATKNQKEKQLVLRLIITESAVGSGRKGELCSCLTLHTCRECEREESGRAAWIPRHTRLCSVRGEGAGVWERVASMQTDVRDNGSRKEVLERSCCVHLSLRQS